VVGATAWEQGLNATELTARVPCYWLLRTGTGRRGPPATSLHVGVRGSPPPRGTEGASGRRFVRRNTTGSPHLGRPKHCCAHRRRPAVPSVQTNCAVLTSHASTCFKLLDGPYCTSDVSSVSKAAEHRCAHRGKDGVARRPQSTSTATRQTLFLELTDTV
jgi:hypothetical protein